MANETDQTEAGWQVQSLRLTTFLLAPLDPNVAATLWKTAVGIEPEFDDSRPREAMRHQAGPFEGAYLGIVVTPGRVDWMMVPRVVQNEPPPAYFGRLATVMNTFIKAGQQWLCIGSPAVNRLAVGAVLLDPSPTVSAAYHKLNGLLKEVHVVPDRSSDFLYQINWPLKSNVLKELKLNRVTRWSALGVRSVNFQVSDGIVQQTPSGEQNYCRLECDHSTANDNVEVFGPADSSVLFRELCDLVLENANKGEVPA